jgi:hypothetical protein
MSPEKHDDSKTISTRFSGIEVQKLEDWAFLLDIPVPEFVRQAIDTHVAHLMETLDILKMVDERRQQLADMYGNLSEQTSTRIETQVNTN